MLKLIDKQAEWIKDKFSPQNQMRIGVVMIWVSLCFLIYTPFSGEQIGIYLMSFLALFYGGVMAVIEAVLAVKEQEKRDSEH